MPGDQGVTRSALPSDKTSSLPALSTTATSCNASLCFQYSGSPLPNTKSCTLALTSRSTSLPTLSQAAALTTPIPPSSKEKMASSGSSSASITSLTLTPPLIVWLRRDVGLESPACSKVPFPEKLEARLALWSWTRLWGSSLARLCTTLIRQVPLFALVTWLRWSESREESCVATLAGKEDLSEVTTTASTCSLKVSLSSNSASVP